MEEPNFEKIGAIVFGMHRLQMAMTLVAAQMANRPVLTEGQIDVQEIDTLVAVGDEYFAQLGSKSDSALKYKDVIGHMRVLDRFNIAIKSGAVLNDIDIAVNACNEGHQLVAELIKEIGYSDRLPPAFMSDRKI